ncbi:MAG: Gfo/Idh/MocA family oxidoreductase [Bryobacteraceae bacterium]|nr:Gfo/Idh/MocA family oxidoreductase [Bryobacteraceae bacterium]
MHRRTFVTSSLLGTAAAWAGANDRIRSAVIGVGGRGMDHIDNLLRAGNSEVAVLCDPDQERLAKGAAVVLERTGKSPRLEADLRRVLEDKSVDVVSIASCNHWHALSTVLACQAGKHVLIEKPLSHTFEEGRRMVEAARKYNRIVQGGTQRRSSGGYRKAIQLIHDGVIGDVYLARWLLMNPRKPIGFKQPEAPPANLNWDLWLGPAPKQPYHANLVHYNWHWFWDFGGGEMCNNGPHFVDVARWGMRKKMPVRITSSGGRYAWKDQAQTPNTQTAIWEFEDGTRMQGELRNHHTPGEETGWYFYGSKGALYISDGGKGGPDNVKGVYKVYLNGSKTPEPDMGRLDDIDHHSNFLSAVRAGKRELLVDEIEELHLSTVPCLLATISYRLGRELMFDPAAQRFTGDDQANRMLSRESRAPYSLPEKL